MLDRLVGKLLRQRYRFPSWVNRAIDYVADHPGSLLGRLAARRLGKPDSADIAAVSTAGDTAIRVLIAPVNYSGQARLWARALEESDPRIAATNMAVDVPGGFSFPADLVVPVAVYHNSPEWQRDQYRAAQGFTHVLVEAEEPLFGRLFQRDVYREVKGLVSHDVKVAFMCHGTDIRLPSRHRELTPWSPYRDPDLYVARLERLARKHRELLDRSGLPVFVSTPDLLVDVPQATWCPVVIEPGRWRATPRDISGLRPLRVAHVPSSARMKGTQLIEPALRRLHDEGAIEYTPVSGVASAEMPAIYRDADVVLDQFRLGSYGAAACEAMAAGCMVVGHVLEDVRQTVVQATGSPLPVVEATPDSLEELLRQVALDRTLVRESGEAGIDFVNAVHDGKASAKALAHHWIEPSQ